MQVAIVHYHLNQGGVTRVIANHLRSLAVAEGRQGPVKAHVFYGGRRGAWSDDPAETGGLEVALHVVPELEYDQQPVAQPGQLADRLRAAFAAEGLTTSDTVLHAHNHTLGKNASLPGALAELATAGYPLLLHIHDFAEDFRPTNYGHLKKALQVDDEAAMSRQLYPQAAHIHYAVLNGRDHAVLTRAGVCSDRIHLLSNPAVPMDGLPPRQQARQRLSDCFGVPLDAPYVLYPVRGIRRKNLGEMLLWSALAQAPFHFAVTLPPINKEELSHYLAWKSLADELQLPCLFDTGAEKGLSFGENLVAADVLLTTSIAEGFGMVFLETWLAQRALIGRDLPEITRDFKDDGLNLDQLMPEFRIPLDWLGSDRVRNSLESTYQQVMEDYQTTDTADASWRSQIDGIVSREWVDFALLETALQQEVIRRALDSEAAAVLRDLNPSVETSLALVGEDSSELIDANRAVVNDHYSAAASGRRLWALYEAALNSPREGAIEPLRGESTILDAFLSPSRLHPIRVA